MTDIKDPTPDAVKALVDAMLGDFGIPVEPEAPKAGTFETQSAAARLGVDAPVPTVRTPREKFLDALQAATVGGNARDIRFGKVPGQVSALDAQKAMQHLHELTAEQRMGAAREALDGPVGKGLSKGARELLEQAAASADGWATAMTKRTSA